MDEKSKVGQTRFLEAANQSVMDTLELLMTEQGLGILFWKLAEQQSDLTTKRVHLLATRARKMHKNRKVLIKIIKLSIHFESLSAKVKDFLMEQIRASNGDHTANTVNARRNAIS